MAHLDRLYLGAVTATGAGAGATAIVPNLVVQIPISIGEALTFLEASVLYTLSAADIHHVDLEDIEKRRLLVMTALAGDAASEAVMKPILGRSVPYWGKEAVKKIPMEAVHKANKILGPKFVAKWTGQTSALILGKQVPMLFGVAIGAVGNHLFGRVVVRATRSILGPAPSTWDTGGRSDLTSNETELIE